MINEVEDHLVAAFHSIYKAPSDDPVIDALCEPFYVHHFVTKSELYLLFKYHNLSKRVKAHDGSAWEQIDRHANVHSASLMHYRILMKGFVDDQNPEVIYLILFRPNRHKLVNKLKDGSMWHKRHSTCIHSMCCNDKVYKLDQTELKSMIAIKFDLNFLELSNKFNNTRLDSGSIRHYGEFDQPMICGIKPSL